VDGTVETAATWAVTGQAIDQAGNATEVRAPVRVLWAVRPWSPSRGGYLDPLKRKRSYWHNEWRNSAIAAVAAAFVAGDRVTLRKRGLYDDQHLPWPAEGRLVRVAILAESPEHARVLVGLLEGWLLLHQGVFDLRPGSGGRTPDREDADQAGVDRAVVTWKRARCLARFDVDVLIRVDGTPWPLKVPAFPPAGRTDEVYLVDFPDYNDELAKYANERRRRDYIERGWLTTGVPAAPDLMGGRK
jgi:hypothetical protein